MAAPRSECKDELNVDSDNTATPPEAKGLTHYSYTQLSEIIVERFKSIALYLYGLVPNEFDENYRDIFPSYRAVREMQKRIFVLDPEFHLWVDDKKDQLLIKEKRVESVVQPGQVLITDKSDIESERSIDNTEVSFNEESIQFTGGKPHHQAAAAAYALFSLFKDIRKKLKDLKKPALEQYEKESKIDPKVIDTTGYRLVPAIEDNDYAPLKKWAEEISSQQIFVEAEVSYSVEDIYNEIKKIAEDKNLASLLPDPNSFSKIREIIAKCQTDAAKLEQIKIIAEDASKKKGFFFMKPDEATEATIKFFEALASYRSARTFKPDSMNVLKNYRETILTFKAKSQRAGRSRTRPAAQNPTTAAAQTAPASAPAAAIPSAAVSAAPTAAPTAAPPDAVPVAPVAAPPAAVPVEPEHKTPASSHSYVSLSSLSVSQEKKPSKWRSYLKTAVLGLVVGAVVGPIIAFTWPAFAAGALIGAIGLPVLRLIGSAGCSYICEDKDERESEVEVSVPSDSDSDNSDDEDNAPRSQRNSLNGIRSGLRVPINASGMHSDVDLQAEAQAPAPQSLSKASSMNLDSINSVRDDKSSESRFSF